MALEEMGNAAEVLVLLTVALTLVYLTVRMRRSVKYRCAVGLALAGAFILVWMNLAVGIIGEPENLANLMYVGVPAVGIIGAVIARFRPEGMVRALFATALAQAFVGVITALAGLGAPVTPLRSLLILNGIFIVLWVGSAWLFQKSTRNRSEA